MRTTPDMAVTQAPGSRAAGERGMTLIELSIVIAIGGILMVIGAGALLRARAAGNEAAAIANLQSINNAQFAYLAGCGQGYYASSLTALGTPVAGRGEGYLSADLATGPVVVRAGYRYAIAMGQLGAAATPDCNGTATQTTYYASSVPQSPGASSSGSRAFATSQNGAIWALPGAVAPTEPFGPPATAAR
jgi:prepilin-type N-terminal cleavage/methylation domain-containing protein